jgi:hypothetical protein
MLRGELAVEVGRGNSSVHQEVAAGDERAVGAHEKRAEGSDLVWDTPALSRFLPEAFLGECQLNAARVCSQNGALSPALSL